MNITTQELTTTFEIFNSGNKNTENSTEYGSEIHGVDPVITMAVNRTILFILYIVVLLVLFLICKQPYVRSLVDSIYRYNVGAFYFVFSFFIRRMELPSNENLDLEFQPKSSVTKVHDTSSSLQGLEMQTFYVNNGVSFGICTLQKLAP